MGQDGVVGCAEHADVGHVNGLGPWSQSLAATLGDKLAPISSHTGLRGAGISEVQQLETEGTPGSRSCFFSGPDGNMWAIQEYKRTQRRQPG